VVGLAPGVNIVFFKYYLQNKLEKQLMIETKNSAIHAEIKS
jgi:hypothetical protein